ncbi:MAG: T9SS type A sorting domain-containing protein [Fidelibacterota bacterium]|nr:MAG: T9SS type A sorting domain-containing protein [Candidatus Neomarinimicrobiota bacterium]
MKGKLLSLAVLWLMGFGLVSAQEVIPVSPGTNAISAALAGTVYSGDILELAAGEYIEEATVVQPDGINLTIRAAAGAEVVWHAPDTVETIHVKANLRLENIIFLAGDDAGRAPICVLNQAGGIPPGDVLTAEKNSIFIDNCMFLRFAEQAVLIPDPADFGDTAYPVDSLFVTNSLIYGGYIGSHQGIVADYDQVRVSEIRNCTAWRVDNDPFKIYGSDDVGFEDYFHLMFDHNTTHDGASSTYPEGDEATGVLVYYIDVDDTLRSCIFSVICDWGFKCKKGNSADAYRDYLLADSVGWRPTCDVCQPWYTNMPVGPNCNEDADVKFTDPNNGDFSLQTGSDAIGAAHDGTDAGNLITDWSTAVELAGSPVLRIDDPQNPVLQAFSLNQNYPNPFNPSTRIAYSIRKSLPVTLDIYDIVGRKVCTLVNEVQHPDSYSITWDGRDDHGNLLAGGVYFYRLQAGTSVETRKMVLLK